MPKGQPTKITTPVGRIVWGNPLKATPRIDNITKKPVLNQDGTQQMVYSFGLAISKAEFTDVVWPAMAAEAQTAYQQFPPQFSWKYKDGDGVDRQGKPYSSREGYAGCYVLTISHQLPTPPQVVKFNPAMRHYVQLTAEQIKAGDYVRAQISLVVNVPTNPTHTPGLYVNPDIIELVGEGIAIVTGPNADDVFGGQQVALPPGARVAPVATMPGAAPMPGQPMAPQPATMPGMPAGPLPGQPMAPQPAGMPAPLPTPQAPTAPGAVPSAAIPAGMMPPYAPTPGAPAIPSPTAYPSSPAPGYAPPMAPAHDFVQNAGQPMAPPPPPAGAPARIVGYNPQTGQPIYG